MQPDNVVEFPGIGPIPPSGAALVAALCEEIDQLRDELRAAHQLIRRLKHEKR